MLELAKRESEWLDILPGVRMEFGPITTQSLRAARRACGAILSSVSREAREAIAGDGSDPMSSTDQDALFEANDALVMELIRRGLVGWEGVGNSDGEPLALTPDSVELLLADPIAFEAIEAAYVAPFQQRLAEKNGSSGSSNGNSAAATRANDTASSPAAAKSAAKPARTERTNRSQKPGIKS